MLLIKGHFLPTVKSMSAVCLLWPWPCACSSSGGSYRISNNLVKKTPTWPLWVLQSSEKAHVNDLHTVISLMLFWSSAVVEWYTPPPGISPPFEMFSQEERDAGHSAAVPQGCGLCQAPPSSSTFCRRRLDLMRHFPQVSHVLLSTSSYRQPLWSLLWSGLYTGLEILEPKPESMG